MNQDRTYKTKESTRRAVAKYRLNNREIVNQKAKEYFRKKYHEDEEFRLNHLELKRAYRRRKKAEKMAEQEQEKNQSNNIYNAEATDSRSN